MQRLLGELSCAECHRLKLKCDKKLPCASCERRGCESICPLGEPRIYYSVPMLLYPGFAGLLAAGQGTR